MRKAIVVLFMTMILAGCERQTDDACNTIDNTVYSTEIETENSTGQEQGQESEYETGYSAGYDTGHIAGYEEGYQAGLKEAKDDSENILSVRTVTFSGAFTATVEKLLPDYFALSGNTVAVVHYFQCAPFLIRFDEDMSDKLEEGKTYVFDFEPFEVNVTSDNEYPDIQDYMYSIHVTAYHIAEENETGLNSISARIQYKQEAGRSCHGLAKKQCKDYEKQLGCDC